jgi:hypothetical protein
VSLHYICVVVLETLTLQGYYLHFLLIVTLLFFFTIATWIWELHFNIPRAASYKTITKSFVFMLVWLVIPISNFYLVTFTYYFYKIVYFILPYSIPLRLYWSHEFFSTVEYEKEGWKLRPYNIEVVVTLQFLLTIIATTIYSSKTSSRDAHGNWPGGIIYSSAESLSIACLNQKEKSWRTRQLILHEPRKNCKSMRLGGIRKPKLL